MTYSIIHNQIIDSEGRIIKCSEILDDVDEFSRLFDKVDFETASFVFSSISATIFIPSDNSKKRPVLSYSVCDSSYNEHFVESFSQDADYVIVDDLFCIIDNEQVKEINRTLKEHRSGIIEFSLVSKAFESNSDLISIIESDDKCILVSDVSVTSGNPNYPLYQYQQKGATWINSVIEEGVGCVLADEMGLGKSSQVIAVLTAQASKGTSLVIVPNSLKENWKREFAKFSPFMRVFVYGGKDRLLSFKRLNHFDVVITSYDTASNDFSLLKQIKWNLIVLDEAQAIKNAGTNRSSFIRQFPKRIGIAISGTPFENHITDVWSIFNFCFPQLLGNLNEFKNNYSDSEDSALKLERIISPLLLRRKVADVKKDLPEKIIIDTVLEMSSFEAEQYERIRASLANKNDKISLGAIQKLRQFCALPSIVDESLSRELPTDISEKFNHLIEVLNAIYQKKEKVIIFTSWIPAQKVILDTIRSLYGVKCFCINGSIPESERQKEIDRFSSIRGFSALVINPAVGGFGLNITAANHVVFYTLEWNPSLEDQCIGRAARIGQTKTVFVYRFYYCNTVEEVMNDRIIKKKTIREALIQGNEGNDRADILKALSISPLLTMESCL